MIRGNLGLAMQGLAVVPLFAGYDLDRRRRAASSPTTSPAAATRSTTTTASAPARCSPAASLKKLLARRTWTPPGPSRVAVEALYDAADDDSATGGPDIARRIFPIVAVVDADGRTGACPDDELAAGGRRPSLRPTRRRRPGRRPAMTMPFYVSPEQLHEGPGRLRRARASPAAAPSSSLGYDDGIAFVAENPSRALHKVSEIYDRIGFAAVGKYNEFENLRVAGVRYADLRGYSYDRRDVTARGLANAYAQTLGTVFTRSPSPTRSSSSSPRSGDDTGRRPDLPAHLRRLGRRRARLRRDGRPGRPARRRPWPSGGGRA